MKINATNDEAQKIHSDIYQEIVNYIAQPEHIKLFISRKKLNLDAFVYTVEQLMGRLTVIRILEDTGQLPQPVLQPLLKMHQKADNDGEELWEALLDIFLDMRLAMEKEDDMESVWSLSGVDELHIQNKTTRKILDLYNQLDFSDGLQIAAQLDSWIKEMSKAFCEGLEGTLNKRQKH
ncbi:hypothetical protein [Desulfofalx alkaliphila]|uniref:hypothetical protein n=1 Tax=Desulfofalx alkaliphila TaxID=105483 RepID=UPI0004E0CAC0|nr:hypothetical protein [Desulfofalx alkaliphila]